MLDSVSHIGLYRAGITDPKRLRDTMVARHHILDDTIEILRGAAGKKSKHHLLFIGPRGIGKTHLLSLVENSIERDEKLRSQYVVARFPEESNRTLSFADFLIGLCEILVDVLPDEVVWSDLFEKIQTEEDNATVVDRVVPVLREQNRKHDRTLLVMLENLGELFTRQIKDKNDLASMRKFFMGDNGCMLVATAPLHFDAITDVGQPFYDFFDTQILDSLSFEDTLELIRKNLEWEKRDGILENFKAMRPKLQAIYRMTGGNPRLTMMLYELIAHDSVTKVQDQFQILLDRISPFYQDRLNDLPPKQRALLESMATMRDQEKTPAAIAEKLRISQQETSSLLKRLVDARYLNASPHPEDKRSRLYTIREGFFDIWLAMNLSRGARKRLPFLLRFFNEFYPSIDAREEKRAILRSSFEKKEDEDVMKSLDYLSEIGGRDEKMAAKFSMARLYAQKGHSDEVLTYLREAEPLAEDSVGRSIFRVAESGGELDYLTEVEKMIECWEIYRSGDFEHFAERIAELGNGLNVLSFTEAKLSFMNEALEALPDGRAKINQRLRIAGLLMDLARWSEAEPKLRISLTEAERLGDKIVLARVLNNLADLLQATNKLKEAEPLMRRALEIDEMSYGAEESAVSIKLNNLAGLLMDTNRFDEAEPLLKRALKMDELSYGVRSPQVAVDLNNLAHLLQATNRLIEAEPLMKRALEIDEGSFGVAHPRVATRLNNLAGLFMNTDRLEEAEPLIRRALEISEAFYGNMHPEVATRLNNLAGLLKLTNRSEEAEVKMWRVLDIDEMSYGVNHPNVARDLDNLAQHLAETQRLEEAERLMRRAFIIRLNFKETSGYEHPLLRGTEKIYRQLLSATGKDTDAINEAIKGL